MSYEKYARRTCACEHHVGIHRLIQGDCKICSCIQFTSQDGYTAVLAQKWQRRLHNPMWWLSWVLLLGCFVFTMHALIVLQGPMPWWLHVVRIVSSAVIFYKLGKLVAKGFGRIGAWMDRQQRERPYDDLQLKRIEEAE